MQIPNKENSVGCEFKYIRNHYKETIIIKIIIGELKICIFLRANASYSMCLFFNVLNISRSLIKWLSFAVTQGGIQLMQKIMLQWGEKNLIFISEPCPTFSSSSNDCLHGSCFLRFHQLILKSSTVPWKYKN